MEAKLRLSGIVNDSIVDGDGIRMTVFVQGCPHRCEGCHNPQTHDFNGGYDKTIKEIFEDYKKNPLLSGITFSGGEPFCQAEQLVKLAKAVREIGGNIWSYSGYTFEEIVAGKIPFGRELLENIDVLVDGKFMLEEKNLTLWFRGSENQRVIDVKKSLEANEVVLYALEEEAF